MDESMYDLSLPCFKFHEFTSVVYLVFKSIVLQRGNVPENIKLLYKLVPRALLEFGCVFLQIKGT